VIIRYPELFNTQYNQGNNAALAARNVKTFLGQDASLHAYHKNGSKSFEKAAPTSYVRRGPERTQPSTIECWRNDSNSKKAAPENEKASGTNPIHPLTVYTLKERENGLRLVFNSSESTKEVTVSAN
jgi:hypothetical protein